ncbi:MAG: hypothetical protein QXX17_00085 [Conexivisphaerales archaeon]
MRKKRISYPLSAVPMAMLGTLAGFGSVSGIYSGSSVLMLEEGILLSMMVGIFLLLFRELSEGSIGRDGKEPF